MSDDDKPGDSGAGGDQSNSGPGAVYQPFVIMEELLDKLKLLHYDDGYCRQLGFKPFSRHYFALATKSGEQFFAFASIAAWLLQMCGKHVEQPQEFDDPNAVIAIILDELRQLGHKVDFPPNRLKSGSGEHCLWVLDRLSDEALRAKNFAWKRPLYPEEEGEDENIVDDSGTAELNLEHNDDGAVLSEEDFEEDEHILGLDDLERRSAKQSVVSSAAGVNTSKPEVILESNQDAAEWKLEVERVLPQLLPDKKRHEKLDWRSHVDEMHMHQRNIDDALKETSAQLSRLYDEIHRTLEKVASREKYLNSHLEHHLDNFRVAQDRLAETKEQYRQASGGVSERTRLLAEVSDELEHIKQELEERGSTMTDGAPLARIRQGIEGLRRECQQMDIRIGVLQHVLLRQRLKEKNRATGRPTVAMVIDDDINDDSTLHRY
jgi:estrogen-related receptor beta like 1